MPVVASCKFRRLSNVVAALGAAAVAGEGMGPMTLELRGDLVTTQHWYTDIALGTPSQELPLLVHTGSSFLTVPCAETCGHRCSPYEHQQFNTQASHTAIFLGADRCPAFAPPSGSRCEWSREFALESMATAAVAQDVVFGRSDNLVTFGCYVKTTGELLEGTVSGVLGLAPGLPAEYPGASYSGFAQELLGHFQHKAFSLSIRHIGGALVLGDVIPSSGVAQIALDTVRGDYAVGLKGMLSPTMPSLKLGAASFGSRTVVDTSESVARFPHETTLQLYDVLEASCRPVAGCTRAKDPSNCFMVPSRQDPTDHFPTLTLLFESVGGGEAHVNWEPKDYLSKNAPTLWCVSFDSHDIGETILGAAWLVGRKATFVLQEPMYIATEGVTDISWASRLLDVRYLAVVVLLGVVMVSILCVCSTRSRQPAIPYQDVHLMHPPSPHFYGPQPPTVHMGGFGQKW